MPQIIPNTSPIAVSQSVTNVVGPNAGLQVKTGRGSLGVLSINTGASGATVALYDGTSASGTKLGTFSAVAQFAEPLGFPFRTGLFVVVTGAPDVTISFT